LAVAAAGVVVPAAVASAAEEKIVDIEKAIRVLKRKIQRVGIFRELNNRMFYEKPFIKKKRKRIEAQKRRQKTLHMSKQGGGSRSGTRS
jgi:small subunit ribosomal protein S21